MRIIISFVLISVCLSCYNHTASPLKQTIAKVNMQHIDMQYLQYNIPRDTIFTITNTGEYPLVIQNVETSCGCTSPTWTVKPIKPGDKAELKISYDAAYPGRFHKTISVFANVQDSPILLSISGEVEYNEQVSVINYQ